MRKVTKRAAAFSAAIAGVALIGSGCQGSDENKGNEATTTPSATTSSTVAETPETTTEPGTATESGAPSSTQMAGENGMEYTVSGPILEKYNSLDDTAQGYLGERGTSRKRIRTAASTSSSPAA